MLQLEHCSASLLEGHDVDMADSVWEEAEVETFRRLVDDEFCRLIGRRLEPMEVVIDRQDATLGSSCLCGDERFTPEWYEVAAVLCSGEGDSEAIAEAEETENRASLGGAMAVLLSELASE